MAEHIAEDQYDLSAWKGTPSDVADLFERAYQLALEADPSAERRSLSITVKTDTGEISFDDSSEFREYGMSGKLADAKAISAHVSAWNSGVRVMIWLHREAYEFSGAKISVSGTNHVAVSGLTKQLAQQLGKGKRHRPHLGWFLLIGSLVAIPISFGLGWAEDESSGAAKWVLFGVFVLMWLGLATSPFTLPHLVPRLEILDPDDPRTRYELWRGKLLAGIGALLLVVIGAVLQAALTS